MGSPKYGRKLRGLQFLRVAKGIPNFLGMSAHWAMQAQVPQDCMAIGHPGKGMHEQCESPKLRG